MSKLPEKLISEIQATVKGRLRIVDKYVDTKIHEAILMDGAALAIQHLSEQSEPVAMFVDGLYYDLSDRERIERLAEKNGWQIQYLYTHPSPVDESKLREVEAERDNMKRTIQIIVDAGNEKAYSTPEMFIMAVLNTLEPLTNSQPKGKN